MRCPRCKREFERLFALSRKDNKTMICDQCGTEEALEDYQRAMNPTPQVRTRAQVYATGNKWAIENFEATHS